MEKPLLYRVSFRIVNLAAFFLASSASYGRWLSWRNDMIGVIQLLVLWIANVRTSSMLGHSWISIFKPVLVNPSSDDVSFVISSAIVF